MVFLLSKICQGGKDGHGTTHTRAAGGTESRSDPVGRPGTGRPGRAQGAVDAPDRRRTGSRGHGDLPPRGEQGGAVRRPGRTGLRRVRAAGRTHALARTPAGLRRLAPGDAARPPERAAAGALQVGPDPAEPGDDGADARGPVRGRVSTGTRARRGLLAQRAGPRARLRDRGRGGRRAARVGRRRGVPAVRRGLPAGAGPGRTLRFRRRGHARRLRVRARARIGPISPKGRRCRRSGPGGPGPRGRPAGRRA